MFNKLKAVKDLAKSPTALKDMVQMQRKLKREEVTVEHGGVVITIRGDMNVRQVKVNGELRHDLRDAFNRAVKEIQQTVARKMLSGP